MYLKEWAFRQLRTHVVYQLLFPPLTLDTPILHRMVWILTRLLMAVLLQ